MTRSHLRTGICRLICLALLAGAGVAAEASPILEAGSPEGRRIEDLGLQFVAARSASQRKQIVAELSARAAHRTPEMALALHRAVTTMLPEADTPEEAQKLLELAAMGPEVVERSALPKDRGFLVDARVAARMARRASGELEMLADVRVDHLRRDSLGRDGLVLAHVQQVWRINSTAAARSFSPRGVMYAAMSERLYVARARVLHSGGGEETAVASSDSPVVERSSAMYFDSQTRDLHFSPLTAGDVVEVEYYLLPAGEVNPWAGYYARVDLFRDALPARLRRRVVVAPSRMTLHVVEHGLAPAVVRRRGSETTRIWEAREVPAQAVEPLSPGASDMGPYLHVSTIGSLEEFGRWYESLLEPSLKLDANLQGVAAQIRQRNLTTAEKVQAVYETVQRSTKYVAFEFGVHSYQPYSVSTVERRGFGDCKDKAAMIVSLLRAVGVEAEFAMVRTRSAGGVDANAYSVQLFNHAVAYVPALHLFLDGTAEYAAPGELPPDDQGAIAVSVDAEGRATRRQVPFTAARENRVTREVRAKMDAAGLVDFESETKYDGYFASEQRRNSESNDIAGSYRAALAQFYPKIKIAHAVAEGTARASREVELKITGSIDAAGGGREVVLRSSLNVAGLEKKYAGERTRRNPLLVPVTPSEVERFSYELPEGAGVTLPPETRLSSPFGRVEVRYRSEGRRLEVETYTELVPQTVAAADYAGFRAFCQAADQALQREVRIVLQ